MIVVWRGPALADLRRIVKHVESENPLAARRVARDLVLAGDSLAIFPNRGRSSLTSSTRELATIRPYVIVYRIVGDNVRILRIWHAAQDRP